MTTTVQLLRDLIALPSINPECTTPDDPRAGEQRVADFIAATAASAGLDVSLQPVAPGRPNVLARLSPPGRVRQRVVLAPHMDTVGGSSPKIFMPVIKSGRMHGRGACDTKGSVAAMLSALMELARSKTRPAHTEILFAGLVDEEGEQAGSRALVRSGFRADLAIVGEPTLCRVVTAHKGSIWVRIETEGKAAHGARPELGVNAVYLMARIVAMLEKEYAPSLTERHHPVLGHATISVGTIQGGRQPNIVPDHCMIDADRRTLPGETEASVLREVRALLRRHGIKASIRNAKPVLCPPMETDPEHPLVRQLHTVAGQTVAHGVDFFCDAAVLAGAGIPSLVFGPGDIAQAHTADEWISLESLEQARRLLVQYLRNLA
jgi:acetylornithine deacetylase/succinyl-diaminopimelate desuccinylase family protein